MSRMIEILDFQMIEHLMQRLYQEEALYEEIRYRIHSVTDLLNKILTPDEFNTVIYAQNRFLEEYSSLEDVFEELKIELSEALKRGEEIYKGPNIIDSLPRLD